MHQEKVIVAADIMLCLTLPELNTVSPNVGMGQKDFTPPTIQLCSHLFLLCHQKTIFWRLLLLTTHLSSSNYSVVGQPSIKEVFLQRRRRHKQIIRQSTVQSLMGAKLPGTSSGEVRDQFGEERKHCAVSPSEPHG